MLPGNISFRTKIEGTERYWNKMHAVIRDVDLVGQTGLERLRERKLTKAVEILCTTMEWISPAACSTTTRVCAVVCLPL